jgi:hypothetical protein
MLTCFGQWKSSQRMAPATPDVEMFKERQIEGAKNAMPKYNIPTHCPLRGRRPLRAMCFGLLAMDV